MMVNGDGPWQTQLRVPEPDGYGCVQWTSCYRCDGKDWAGTPQLGWL